MKKVNYTVESHRNMVVVIRITKEEVGDVIGMRQFCGWGVKDAIRNANKRLRLYGYEIEEAKNEQN